jgi:hypothetical protein
MIEVTFLKYFFMQPRPVETKPFSQFDILYKRIVTGRCINAIRVKALIQNQALENGLSVQIEFVVMALHRSKAKIAIYRIHALALPQHRFYIVQIRVGRAP